MLEIVCAVGSFFTSAPTGAMFLVTLLVGVGQAAMSGGRTARWVGPALGLCCALVATLMLMTLAWERRNSPPLGLDVETLGWLAVLFGAVWAVGVLYLAVKGEIHAWHFKRLENLCGEGFDIIREYTSDQAWSNRWNDWQGRLDSSYSAISPRLVQRMQVDLSVIEVELMRDHRDPFQPEVDRRVMSARLRDLREFLDRASS